MMDKKCLERVLLTLTMALTIFMTFLLAKLNHQSNGKDVSTAYFIFFGLGIVSFFGIGFRLCYTCSTAPTVVIYSPPLLIHTSPPTVRPLHQNISRTSNIRTQHGETSSTANNIPSSIGYMHSRMEKNTNGHNQHFNNICPSRYPDATPAYNPDFVENLSPSAPVENAVCDAPPSYNSAIANMTSSGDHMTSSCHDHNMTSLCDHNTSE